LISEAIWKAVDGEKKAKLPSPRKRRVHKGKKGQNEQRQLPLAIPEDPQALQKDPTLIRRFRSEYHFHQAELAEAIGISRESLSRYERKVRPLPDQVADDILTLWKNKATT
jgi:DNA-binding transcriptional regulator YiaG